MKKIYIILISAVAMLIAIDAQAQLSVGAGYNNGTTVVAAGDEKDSDDMGGFFIEAAYDINILDNIPGTLSLQPGARLRFHGETDSEEILGVKTKTSTRESYLDIPVNVKYSYDLGFAQVSAFAGPVLSMGLTSGSKLSATAEDSKTVLKTNNYTGKVVAKGGDSSGATDPDGPTYYGRFDIKFGLGLGATIAEKYNVKVGYDIGLLNRYTAPQSGDFKIKKHDNVFYIGVGYNF